MKKTIIFLCFFTSIVFSETIINQGPVSGIWNKESSPYQIMGDILVNEGSTLNIEPGVEILFSPNSQLYVKGTLLAQGTESDSILFSSSNADSVWKGIKFWGMSKPEPSEIDYCIIENCCSTGDDLESLGGAIFAYFTELSITHSHIHNNTVTVTREEKGCGGLFVHKAEAEIFNNIFQYNVGDGGSGGGGICLYSNKALIAFNKIENNQCIHSNNNFTTGAIHFSSSKGSIYNNLILNNQGQNVNTIFSRYNENCFYNNTIYNNNSERNNKSLEIHLGSIYNNIIYNNQGTLFIGYNAKLNNNCIQGYDSKQDSSFDTRQFNFDLNPRLLDPGNNNFHLAANSPCIDAGAINSDYSNEPYPNGDMCNLGYYGNTAEATTSLPDYNINTTEINYDSVKITTLASKSFKIKNTGPATLVLTLPLTTLQHPFTCKTDSIQYVYPNDSVKIPITYSPMALNHDTAHFRITTNKLNNKEIDILLHGVGVASKLVSNTITIDQSPFIICQDLYYNNKKKLTIEPGVVVKCDTNITIEIASAIKAIGTLENPITFTSIYPDSESGYWNGILTSSENSEFKYCNFSFAKTAIEYERSDNVYIKNCHITDCQNYGIKVASDILVVENCEFDRVNEGIYFSGSTFRIENNKYNTLKSLGFLMGIGKIINNYAINITSGFKSRTNSLQFIDNTLIGTGKPHGIKKRFYVLWKDTDAGVKEGLVGKTGVILRDGEQADAWLSTVNPSLGIIKLSTGTRRAVTDTKLPFQDVTTVPASGYTTNANLEWGHTLVIKTLDGGHLKLETGGSRTVGNFTNHKTSIAVWGTYIPAGETNFPVNNEESDILYDGLNIYTYFSNGHLTLKNNVISNFANRGISISNAYIESFTNNKIYSNGDAGVYYDCPNDVVANRQFIIPPGNINQSNEIYNNEYQFINSSPFAIDLPYTYWGPEDSTSVDNMILDQSEINSLGKVNFIPFLDAYNNPLTEIESTDSKPPLSFNLLGMYPNPANPTVNIAFELGKTDHVEINIYNVLGQHIKSLCNTRYTVGQHNLTWHGLDNQGLSSPSGVYIVTIKCGDVSINKRMALVR